MAGSPGRGGLWQRAPEGRVPLSAATAASAASTLVSPFGSQASAWVSEAAEREWAAPGPTPSDMNDAESDVDASLDASSESYPPGSAAAPPTHQNPFRTGNHAYCGPGSCIRELV